MSNRTIKIVSASWCKQCQVLKDMLTRNGVIYQVIDADENMEFCMENNIKSLPTTLIYEEDEVKIIRGVGKLEEYV
jgi:glutaredoxin